MAEKRSDFGILSDFIIGNYALFKRSKRGRPRDRVWTRAFPQQQGTREWCAKKYQSYLLTGILPGEDGDPNFEYEVQSLS